MKERHMGKGLRGIIEWKLYKRRGYVNER